MRLASVQTFLAVILTIQLGVFPEFAAAAPPAIGTIVTKGAFRLDHATLINNATLFEGATVETGEAVSRLELSSGTRLELGPDSKGRFFGDHLVLEGGQTRIDKANGFHVEARGLTIQPDTGVSTGRILLAGNTRVQVAALTGSFRVLNSRGMEVANIPSGMALVLEPQSAAGAARLTGRLVNRGGHYLLKDETTNVTVEIAALGMVKEELAKQVGRRVEVTGSTDPVATPVSDATQVILVARMMQAPTSEPPPPASGGGTAPAGSGGAGGGRRFGGSRRRGGAAGASSAAISVTMIAVIGGVAAAAVVGGLVASGSLAGSTAAPVSR